MRKINLILLYLTSLMGCKAQETPTQFSLEALKDTFVSLEGKQVTFADTLKQHKGRTVVIDVLASWFRDCIKGMPKVKKLHENNSETVFLSLDKTEAA